MSEESLKELIAEKRREYKRQWNAKNRGKCREYERKYWENRILRETQEVKSNDSTN